MQSTSMSGEAATRRASPSPPADAGASSPRDPALGATPFQQQMRDLLGNCLLRLDAGGEQVGFQRTEALQLLNDALSDALQQGVV